MDELRLERIVGTGQRVTFQGSGRGTQSGCQMPLCTSIAAGGGHRGEGAWQKQVTYINPWPRPRGAIRAAQHSLLRLGASQQCNGGLAAGRACPLRLVAARLVVVACHIGQGVLDRQQRANGCCTRKERLESKFHTRASTAEIQNTSADKYAHTERWRRVSCADNDGPVQMFFRTQRFSHSPSLGDLGIDVFTGGEPTNPTAKETKSKKHGRDVHQQVLAHGYSSHKEEGRMRTWGKKGEASNDEPWQFLFSRLVGLCAVCSEETPDGML